MSESLLSPSWYRVAALKPQVRSHARFHRHLYRGAVWYVLQDHASGRCHRLTPAAYQLVGLMDGERTTQQIWDAANTRLGDDGPTQGETIRLLGLLHSADVLRCDVSPDTAELFRRCQRRERSEGLQRLLSPLSIRVPLVDPDAFLDRWLHVVRPLFTRWGAAAWCGVVAAALLLAGANWAELSEVGARQLLDPRNLLVLWFVYPAVKALHELGHAFATKVWGGEVHEMGVLFLVLVPVPYVDASASSVFPDKGRRMLVGAAGIGVELFLAALALLVWLAVEPGLVRQIAYDVMLIGGASTLLFNGNPLLRFDGYYVLADAIEIPNLKSRSNQYLAYLVLHRLFGLDTVRNPLMEPGEAPWFVGYGITSFVYRLTVLFAIAVFVSGKFFVLGVLLAGFVVATSVVFPLLRQAAFVLTSPRLGAQRPRALVASAAIVFAVAVCVFLLPLPLVTRTEGVVWPPEGAQVRANGDGFVTRILAEPDSLVEPGQPLILTRDPGLEADVAVLEARLGELRARHHAERLADLVRAQIVSEELATAEAALARARERAGQGVIRSPTAGRFVAPGAEDLVGRFLEQGELVGYVVGPEVATARVVVPQADVALVRHRTREVELRRSSRLGEVLPARVRREVPAATDRLPTRALGATAGGRFAVDPADPDGLRTLEKVFHFDVSIPAEVAAGEIGGRVHVRFHHGFEPLAARGYRALRRLFLRRLGA